jgi:hypothetical protein
MNGSNLTNLHAIWDEEIIDHRVRRYFQSDIDRYYNYLQSLMLNQSVLVNGTVTDFQLWADESIMYVCTQVYFDDNNIKINTLNNFTLGEPYFERNWPLVDQRLTQAAHRLSLLINSLSMYRSARKLTPDMQTFIISVCVVLMISLVLGLVLHCLGKRTAPAAHALLSEQS